MFKVSFSSIKDVISFVEATDLKTLEAVLQGVDHLSLEHVNTARSIAKDKLYRIDVINRNNGNNTTHQWVDIDLSCNEEGDHFLAALDALMFAKVEGDHTGKDTRLTKAQIKEEVVNLELVFNCYRVFNK